MAFEKKSGRFFNQNLLNFLWCHKAIFSSYRLSEKFFPTSSLTPFLLLHLPELLIFPSSQLIYKNFIFTLVIFRSPIKTSIFIIILIRNM